MWSTQKIWCRHFGIDIHNRPQEKMIRGKWYQKKNCAKNSDTKNDTEKVVQKYGATKNMRKTPGWENICGKLCGKCFHCVGNRMLIKLLHRILEGCDSCFKTAIPKTLTCFPCTGEVKKFISPFKFCHMHKPHFSAYFSAYFRIFPHFFRIFFQGRPTA